MAVRFGYWSPVFGGWLRNVDIAEERTPLTFEHLREIAQFAEGNGFDLTLVPELNLNDIRGYDGDTFDAWTTSAALAAVTERLEIMAAVRPAFHLPAIAAKQAATINEISGGRFTLNVVSAWWEEESRQYGGVFSAHDDRYVRSREFVDVLKGLWTQPVFDYDGEYYRVEGAHLAPKPTPVPALYAGGESEAGKEAIVQFADSYLTHGGTVEELRRKIGELVDRRAAAGREPFTSFGMAAYPIVRDTDDEVEAELARITEVRSGPAYESYQEFVSKSHLEVKIDLKDYSVSNRGLRPGLIGTPQQVAERIMEFADAGVSVLLLQFSPQLEEMRRFARDVIPLVRAMEAERDSVDAA